MDVELEEPSENVSENTDADDPTTNDETVSDADGGELMPWRRADADSGEPEEPTADTEDSVHSDDEAPDGGSPEESTSGMRRPSPR